MNIADQPAFPDLTYNETTGKPDGHNKGMTMRQYAAIKFMAALLSAHDSNGDWTGNTNTVARDSVDLADQLMVELSKPLKP